MARPAAVRSQSKRTTRSRSRVWKSLAAAGALGVALYFVFSRSKAPPEPEPQAPAAEAPAKLAPPAIVSSWTTPKLEPVASAAAADAEVTPTPPDVPMDRASFNKRKAAMIKQALDDTNNWIKYPLWSSPLSENMRYKAPVPFHGTHPGPNGALPTLEFWTDKVNYAPGEAVKVFAQAHGKDGSVVRFDAITAHTFGAFKPRPDVALEFTEGPDLTYVATLNVAADVARKNRGEWDLNVDCQIEAEHRVGHNQVYFMATDATVTGPYRIALENGSLAVYVTINATAASLQHLKGELWTTKGDPIAYAWVRNDHTPEGSSEMKLVFYGKTIRDSGFDGPYSIKNLVLTTYDSDYVGLANDPVDPNLVTPAFARTVFTDVPINGDNATLNEKKATLEGELKKAQSNGYDPNHPDPPAPVSKIPKNAPPPQ